MQIRSFLIPGALMLALTVTAGCASSPVVLEDAKSPYVPLVQLQKEEILHLPTGTRMTSGQLMDVLADARVIYVGESHDNMENHRVQMEIIRALETRFPGRIAIGMEMFTKPSQPVLDKWVQGDLPEKDFFRTWTANWSYDYDFYRPIFEFARERNIPLLALNAPKQLTKTLSAKGMAGLSDEEKKALPEIDMTDPYYRATVEAIFGGHAHGSGIDRFLEVQLLWDETMAESMAVFLKDPANKDKKMVVLAGGGHVQYGIGIPKRVFRRLPASYFIVLPATPRLYGLEEAMKKGDQGKVSAAHAEKPHMMDVKMPDMPMLIADYIWAVDYTGLGMERVKLGVQVSGEDGRVKVVGVAPKSAAETAGIQPGDVIVSLDEEEIKEVSDLTYLLRQKKPGDTGRLVLERDGGEVLSEARFVGRGHHE